MNNKAITKIFFRLERLLIFALFAISIKFNPNQFAFWLSIFLVSIILNKFEDSIRAEYNDTTRDRLKRLREGEEDENLDD